MEGQGCRQAGRRRLALTLLLSCVLLLGALAAASQAQITLDGSRGPAGPLTGPNYRIGAELGQLRGSNLFHSFGQFNVHTRERATFTGPNTIANILSRVTGGQPSSIDGLLRSEIAGANLFLLNPNGVLFGPNASLDVSGSFHVSTADFLRFTDGAIFAANLGHASLLTVAPPSAFGFLGTTPAPIAFQGRSAQAGPFEVPPGQALSVVGGDLAISGNPLFFDLGRPLPSLRAPGGRLTLASVAGAGELPLNLAEWRLEALPRLGSIAVTQGAFLDASGDGGGTVLLRGGHLLVDHSHIFTDTLGPLDGARLGLDL
jgi:filamentous hemagglutinin family protein